MHVNVRTKIGKSLHLGRVLFYSTKFKSMQCERNTVKSTLAQLKSQSRHRRAQPYTGAAAVREERYRPTDNKDETDEAKIPRHKRCRQTIVDFFRFFVFVPKGKLFLHEVCV